MMNGYRSRRSWVGGTAIVYALAFAVPLQAQPEQAQADSSVSDFRLPPATPEVAPAQGPVDPDNPVARPSAAVPTQSDPIPPAPVIVLPPPSPQTASSRATSRPAATPSSPAVDARSPVPVESPSAAAEIEGEALPAPSPSVSSIPVNEPADPRRPSLWPWLAGGGTVLTAILLAAWAIRRRKPDVAESEDTLAEVAPSDTALSDHTPAAAAPTPEIGSPLSLQEDSLQDDKPQALPSPTFGLAGLDVRLEARHLSRAMVNATLAYRLVVTNRALTALGPLRVSGDITTAHASLSGETQLALASDGLGAIHELAALEPGEAVTVSGELRLPLASILPMRSGHARVFVPLAHFRFEATGETGESMTATRVFVVGRAGGQPDGTLRPFQFDRGPGVIRSLGQREVNPFT